MVASCACRPTRSVFLSPTLRARPFLRSYSGYCWRPSPDSTRNSPRLRKKRLFSKTNPPRPPQQLLPHHLKRRKSPLLHKLPQLQEPQAHPRSTHHRALHLIPPKALAREPSPALALSPSHPKNILPHIPIRTTFSCRTMRTLRVLQLPPLHPSPHTPKVKGLPPMQKPPCRPLAIIRRPGSHLP